MTANGCDRLWEVDAYRAGLLGAKDGEAFERHLRRCPVCRARIEGDERLRELASAIPGREPTQLTLRRMRSRLLRSASGADAPGARKAASRRAFAAALVVAIGAAGLALRGRHVAPRAQTSASTGATQAPAPRPSESLAGTVTASSDARWSQTRRGDVEVVELAAGLIHVVVRPQVAGERFLIELPDGELEVRGTTFDVDVRERATRHVRVAEGIVELRLQGRSALRLGPSESWPTSPEVVAPAAPVARSSRPSHPQTAPAPATSASALDDPAADYAEAVARLQDSRYDDAASRFRAFVVAHPDATEAEDASFLEAVALARAGRLDAAALAAEHHLARFPGSFHAREAAILVARSASQRFECDKARRAVAPWSRGDAAADIPAALGACANGSPTGVGADP